MCGQVCSLTAPRLQMCAGGGSHHHKGELLDTGVGKSPTGDLSQCDLY